MDKLDLIKERRNQLRDEINSRISCLDFLEKAQRGGYICPHCGSGTHKNMTGAVKYYPRTNTAACHACPPDSEKKARRFDVMALIQYKYDCDYNEALKVGAGLLNINYDDYMAVDDPRINDGWKQHKAAQNAAPGNYDIHNLVLDDNSWMNDTPTPPAAQEATGGPQPAPGTADDKKAGRNAGGPQKASRKDARVSHYLYTTQRNLWEERKNKDSVVVAYLRETRGLEKIAMSDPWNLLGYDPQSDPASAPFAQEGETIPHPRPRVIVECGDSYVARAIEPNINPAYKMMNPKGYEVELFCEHVIKHAGIIFVTEGVFDALSFLECGVNAVALNGKGNGQKLLTKVKRYKPDPADAFFIICHDNDTDPKTAADTMARMEKLNQDLKDAGYISMLYNVAGEYHDANDALVKDRAGFETRITDATKTITAAAKEKARLENMEADRLKSEAEEERILEQSAEQEESRQEQEKTELTSVDDPPAEPLPGLLTYSGAVDIFKKADDRYLTLKSFPTFSKTAKIKLHDSVVLAADTGAGKSSLALNFLNDLNSEYPCIYFNLEMDNITVLRRLTAIHSGMELDRIEGYKHDEKTAAAVNVSLQAITSRKPLQVIQGAYMLPQIEDIIKRSTKGRKEPTIVFIDHSLLVDIQGHSAGRYDRFTQVSEKLRKMALSYDIILFVLLQQNRSGKADDTERPKNSSLKESGSWENDATGIVFLWYDPTTKRKKLLLTKNRNGSGGEFTLNYWKKTQTYTEAADGSKAGQTSGDAIPRRQTRREKQRQKLLDAYEVAYLNTAGNPTLKAIAEAADVATSTVKTWLKEYGGFMVDGKAIDPAGIDAVVEQQGFVKLTPTDDNENPFDDPKPAGGNGQKVTARF